MDFSTLVRVFLVRNYLRGREYWPHERLRILQEKHLEKLRRHAYKHSPFYKSYHRGVENAPLKALPVLSKRQLMEHFDEIVTDRKIRLKDIYDHMARNEQGNLYLNKYRTIVTSGSTGAPGVFLFDAWMWAHVLAMEFRILDFAGVRPRLNKRSNTACITSGLPWHQSWQIAHTLADASSRNYHYLDAQEALPTIVERLNFFQPRALISYATIIHRLANEALEHRLLISPRRIYCGGETLSEEMRTQIQRAFLVNPFNLYGLTEAGNVASDCHVRSGMHINDDLVILENVDDNFQPVEPGQFGSRVLLSVLFSRVQPLIRYEVSDLLKISNETCPCGRNFRRITAISGREEDAIMLTDSSGITHELHPNFFHSLLDPEPIFAWQLIKDKEILRLRVIRSASSSINVQAIESKLTTALSALGITSAKVVIEFADDLLQSKAGKTRLIMSIDEDKPEINS